MLDAKGEIGELVKVEESETRVVKLWAGKRYKAELKVLHLASSAVYYGSDQRREGVERVCVCVCDYSGWRTV